MKEKEIIGFDKYAIFQLGTKQYQAIEGKTVAIDKLEGEAGQEIEFKEVLFRKNGDDKFEVGQPFLAGKVKATIVKHLKGPKKISLRFKRRKKVRVQKNSRAAQTVVRIVSL
jgi:large subunit ribosomal protein L21